MTRRRVGLWLVGAFGGVGTTITLGLAAMARGLADRTGLVTALPLFRDLPLPEPGDFVVGGHDIRQTTFAESAEEFRRTSGVFDPAWIAACRDDLDAASARVRPGPRLGLSAVVSGLADWGEARIRPNRTPGGRCDRHRPGRVRRQRVDRPPDRPERRQHRAPVPARRRPPALGDARAAAGRRRSELLPASALYALAAIAGRAHLHQLHAQPGRVDPGPRRAGRVDRRRSTPARTARPARP